MKKAPLRQPQAGHAEPCIPYRRFRHGAGAAPFHGAGHIVRLPLGGVPSHGFHSDLIMSALSSDAMALALPILAALPYTASFIDDVKSGFIKEYLPRTIVSRYIAGKAAACAASGGLALGIFIAYGFAALLFLPMEAYPKPGESVPNYFGNLMETALMFFASEAFWSLTGLTFAALTNSKYMAYAKKEKNDMRKTNDKAREGDISIGGMKKSL